MTVDRLAALQQEFDRTYALPRGEPVLTKSYIVIRVDNDRYALSLLDVHSIHAGRTVSSLPSPHASLVGIAAFRGALAPIYDLKLMLGYATRATEARWCMLLRASDTTVGFCFDAFDAHVRATDADLALPPAHAPSANAVAHVRGALRTSESMLPLINTASLLTAVTKLSTIHDSAPKE